MADDRRVLWAYSAHTMKVDHEVGLLATMQRRVVSRSWLTRYVWPLDSGWNPDDKLADDPTNLQKAPQNRDENWGPRSETTS